MAGRPPKKYSQGTRLVSMLRLLAHRWLGASIQEMSENLGVSTRTIDRDLRALAEVVPLRRCAVKGQRGVRLQDREKIW